MLFGRRNQMSYCVQCGRELSVQLVPNEGEIPFCPVCRKLYFPSFNTTVLVAVFDSSYRRICLLRQNYVHQDYMVLVAGYVKKGETAENAALREVKEELGFDLNSLHFVSSYYHEKSNALMLGFYGVTEKTHFILQKEEVDAACWVDTNQTLSSLKPENIGFTHLQTILKTNAFE